MPETVTHTLDVPGGALVYDVIGPLPPADGQRPLFMIGHPMGSSGFAELASHFPDRTVVSYDPRGCDRSQVADADHSPRQNAEDVHQLIGLVGGGPVDVFGSSGGAVTGLALVTQYPDDVAVLVAHEPPILGVLPDADNATGGVPPGDARPTTRAASARAWPGSSRSRRRRASSRAEHLAQPAPDPAMFGLPTEDDGGRDNVLLSGVSDPVIEYRLDPDAVNAAPTRVVIAAGEESRNQVPGRAAAEVAKLLGTDLAMFPSHHGGFNGGDGPYAGKPAEFAARLREVLAAG